MGPGVAFGDGAFHLTGGRHCWAYQFTNGQAAVEAEQVSGPGTKGYGMCFRHKRRGGAQTASGYWLLIASDGGWKLTKSDGGAQSEVTRWATSKAIRTGLGRWNSLAVLCHRDLIDVFINGQLVGEVQDSTYPDSGGVGPICTSDEVEVAFRNLQIDPNQ